MAVQVTDLHLLRDQLLLRRQKLEAATARSQTANLVLLLEQVDKALEKMEVGSYGICELCGKPIPAARLEVIPFTRFTVDCQSKLEKERKLTRSRQPVTSLFGLTDGEEGGEGEEEETTPAEPKE